MYFALALSVWGVLGSSPSTLAQAQPAKETLAEEVVFFEEPNRSKAYEMLASGQMHIYAYGLSDPDLKKKIETSQDLTYTLSYGNTWELTINPSGPVSHNGKLNPFAVAPIREALNWLIDRNYIAQELCFGLARPKFLPLVSAFPDYTRLADVARVLEFKYAHNPGKTKEVLRREMPQLGATWKDGKWWYKDAPVALTLLIRTEDVRKRIGDYVASLLEDIGFTVDRQYKSAAEAGPIWIGSDPSEGKWHLYTGGWINTLIARDQGNTFNYYYTPKGRPDTLWQAYNPSPRFAEIADRLARNDYTSWHERMQLMTEALQLANQESFRVWLVDAINYFPLRKDVGVVSDLAGGIHGSALWAYTLRFIGQPAARMRIGMPSMLTEPWNPIAGSNWIYDQMIIRGTAAAPTLPDPFTGLFLPHRVQSAHVTAQEGVPMIKSLDWVDLRFAPTIDVPGEAWISWDVQALHNGARKTSGRPQGAYEDRGAVCGRLVDAALARRHPADPGRLSAQRHHDIRATCQGQPHFRCCRGAGVSDVCAVFPRCQNRAGQSSRRRVLQRPTQPGRRMAGDQRRRIRIQHDAVAHAGPRHPGGKSWAAGVFGGQGGETQDRAHELYCGSQSADLRGLSEASAGRGLYPL
jgi:peptide/nickel transport system substrate-binding protein